MPFAFRETLYIARVKSSGTPGNEPSQPSLSDSNTEKKLRILIADDHEIVRQGVSGLVQKHGGWEICGEAADGRAAVLLAERLRPDIAVLDMGMPELNGLEAARQIRKSSPETEVIIFTGEESDQL